MLSQIKITHATKGPPFQPPSPSREVPQGCFSSSGLNCLQLPLDISLSGPLACDNCKVLALVDLSSTTIKAIRESTFSHCVNLQHILLPAALQQIHEEAFMCCRALGQVGIPPTLRYIAHQAFLNCDQLTCFKRMPGKRTTWRGPYAEGNAFDL